MSGGTGMFDSIAVGVFVVRIFLLLVVIALTAAGIALPQVKKSSAAGDITLSFWSFDVPGGTSTKVKDLTCDHLKERLTAAAALAIIACFFFAIVTIITIISTMRLHKSSSDDIVPRTSGMTIGITCSMCVAYTFSLTTWAVVVDLWTNFNGCGFPGSLKSQDYTIAPGLALLISAWCILNISNCADSIGVLMSQSSQQVQNNGPSLAMQAESIVAARAAAAHAAETEQQQQQAVAEQAEAEQS